MRRFGPILLLAIVVACGRPAAEVALTRSPDPVVAPASADAAAPAPESAVVPTTAAPATTTSTSAAPAPAPTAAPPAPASGVASAASARPAPWAIEPYVGLGTWVDGFDWSETFGGSPPPLGLDAIDQMAAEGVQTLYIQATRWNSPTDVLEPERLQAIIDRAHGHSMGVVAWYLPTLTDPAADLRRMLALSALDVDGLGVDIESTEVGDVAERNRRLVELSRAWRDQNPGRALSAIVLAPVLIEDVNPRYWPNFPWAELAPYYDVWMPMGYWTDRRGGWRDAYTYTATNVARIRERLGRPDAAVHPIGGVGDRTTPEDLAGMVRAGSEQAVIGGSLYDYRTTNPAFWGAMRSFVRER